MNNLPTDVQDPSSHPRHFAPFAFLLRAPWVVVDRRGEGRKSTLLSGEEIPCFKYKINYLQREVIAGEEGEVAEFPIGTDKQVERWANPLRDVVLDRGVEFEQIRELRTGISKVVDCMPAPVF